MLSGHQLIDARSLAFGTAIAAKLQKHPEFIDLARGTVVRWQSICSEDVQPTLREWRAILDGPIQQIVSTLTASDERSVRLRQSNPFTKALSQQDAMRS